MAIIFLSLIIVAFVVLKLRIAVLLLPVVPLFLSKGFLFLDITNIPIVSFYKLYCLTILVVWVLYSLQKRRSVIPFVSNHVYIGVLSLGLLHLITFVMNPDVFSESLKMLLSFLLDILIPTVIFIQVLSRMNHKELSMWAKMYVFTYMLIAIYAVISYLINYNFFIEFIEKTIKTGRVVVHTYAGTLRGVRAQGTVSHPITFGALMVMIVPVALALLNFKKLSVLFFVSLLIVITVALLYTNSRTPLLFLFVFIGLYLIQLPLQIKFKYIFLSVFGGFLLFYGSDLVNEKVIAIVNIFNPQIGEDAHGSSLDMRYMQFDTSLKYFFMSPFFGNGLSFSRGLIAAGTESTLQNMESLVFIILINFGALGAIFYSVFFSNLYFFKRLDINTGSIDYNIFLLKAFTISYLLFVLATGWVDTFHSFIFVYSFIYFFYKASYLPKEKV